MLRQHSNSKVSRKSLIITNGIYFGQFYNPPNLQEPKAKVHQKIEPRIKDFQVRSKKTNSVKSLEKNKSDYRPMQGTNSTNQINFATSLQNKGTSPLQIVIPKQNQDTARRSFIPKKRLQSPKISSPRQQISSQSKNCFKAQPSPKGLISTQQTNVSIGCRVQSPTKYNNFLLVSDEIENKSIELLQDIVNSQLQRKSAKGKRRPQTAGGNTILTQHFTNKSENYLIQELIGQGSYGIVKSGMNLMNGQQVAVKIYDRQKIIAKKEYIRKEIQILQSLQHPNIVKLLDIIYTETQVQLVMEYGGQMSLRAFLKQQPNRILPENTAKILFLQIVKAIDYCHSRNIIHRDIKLENILIRDDQIKLIDFGFSSYVEHQISQFCGTPSYMAPEIILKIDYGKPADIWSMGILLFVLLHGKFPFQGRDQNELFQKIKAGYYVSTGVSAQAQRLLNNMLRTRSYERWNTKEILKDSWFQY